MGSWIFAEDIADQIRSGAEEVTLQILDLSSGAADAAGAGNSGDFTPEQFRALTPEQLRAHYQYFTEADMAKARAAGFDHAFMSLEDAVADYVRNYLVNE